MDAAHTAGCEPGECQEETESRDTDTRFSQQVTSLQEKEEFSLAQPQPHHAHRTHCYMKPPNSPIDGALLAARHRCSNQDHEAGKDQVGVQTQSRRSLPGSSFHYEGALTNPELLRSVSSGQSCPSSGPPVPTLLTRRPIHFHVRHGRRTAWYRAV